MYAHADPAQTGSKRWKLSRKVPYLGGGDRVLGGGLVQQVDLAALRLLG